MSNKIIIGLLCAVIALLGIMLFSREQAVTMQPVHASGFGGSDSGFIMVTGKDMTGNSDVLFVLDTKERTLLMYGQDRRGLQLKSSRTIKYDLYLDEWKEGSQDPSYDKIKKLTRQKWSPTEEPKKKGR
ncbi:MAG: hypothetical protein ACYS8W_02395 [Planctomycetota bacterium]